MVQTILNALSIQSGLKGFNTEEHGYREAQGVLTDVIALKEKGLGKKVYKHIAHRKNAGCSFRFPDYGRYSGYGMYDKPEQRRDFFDGFDDKGDQFAVGFFWILILGQLNWFLMSF